MIYEKTCPNCGKMFTATDKRQKFCSRKCSSRFRHDTYLEEKTCPSCGKEFIASDHNQKFCSQNCYKRFRSVCNSEQKAIELTCPYNIGVECYEKTCSKCGWHPDVAKARLDKIMGVSDGK